MKVELTEMCKKDLLYLSSFYSWLVHCKFQDFIRTTKAETLIKSLIENSKYLMDVLVQQLREGNLDKFCNEYIKAEYEIHLIPRIARDTAIKHLKKNIWFPMRFDDRDFLLEHIIEAYCKECKRNKKACELRRRMKKMNLEPWCELK